jgi:Zn finger protein HypA/HybF involved in hydrogenase expression
MSVTSAAEPTVEDWEREKRIQRARVTLRIGRTSEVRAAAMTAISELVAQRTPAMLAYVTAHPEAA